MVERHPVADLLTDEMRERVRAAEFEHFTNRIWGPCGIRSANDNHVCPLAVAVGISFSNVDDIVARLRGPASKRGTGRMVRDFARWADDPSSDPADVYVMLGVEPAAPPQEGGHV